MRDHLQLKGKTMPKRTVTKMKHETIVFEFTAKKLITDEDGREHVVGTFVAHEPEHKQKKSSKK